MCLSEQMIKVKFKKTFKYLINTIIDYQESIITY